MDGYQSVRRVHQLLFCLLEMREVEVALMKAMAAAADRTDLPQGKRALNGWASESDQHRRIVDDLIARLEGKALTSHCKSCLEDALALSLATTQMLERLKFEEVSLDIRGLYFLCKKHMDIEKGVEDRYAKMADMIDDEEIKRFLLFLSKDERNHHKETLALMDVIERNYRDVLRGA